MKIIKHLKAFIFVAIWSIVPLSAHPPWGIVIDGEDNIYFADLFHNQRGSVWKLHKDGHLELLLQDFHAHNVSLDPNDNLITAHGEDWHTMVRMNGNTVTDTLFTTRDFNEFFGGNCTYTSAGEIVFSIENQLWRLDEAGMRTPVSDFRFKWNQTVFSDKNGNFYAPDIGRDNGAVVKIDPEGNGKIIATDLISKLDRSYDKHNDVLLGIGKDEDGWLYIAETAGRRIIKFSEEGETETFYRSAEDWIPCGITFKNDSVYILEFKTDGGYEGPQITKISGSGVVSVIFNFEQYRSKPLNKEKEKKKGNFIFIWILFLTGLLFLTGNHLRKNRQKKRLQKKP